MDSEIRIDENWVITCAEFQTIHNIQKRLQLIAAGSSERASEECYEV